jgi:hypothetical protein
MEGRPTMIWQDVVVKRSLCDQEIAKGLAAAFGISLDQIVVRRNEGDFPEPGEARVLCVVSERRSGFRLILSIFTYFAEARHDPVSVLREFARSSQTEILLSDDSVDPYTMTQIMPSGELARATLDVERLDNEDEYHVRS